MFINGREAWKLFELTGKTDFYLIYKEIIENKGGGRREAQMMTSPSGGSGCQA